MIAASSSSVAVWSWANSRTRNATSLGDGRSFVAFMAWYAVELMAVFQAGGIACIHTFIVVLAGLTKNQSILICIRQ